MDSSSTSSFKVFACRFLYLVVVLFAVDFAVGSALSRYYFQQRSGLNYRTTYSLTKADQDIIILGSSRANHHYVPSILAGELGYKSCYNTGRDGQGLPYFAALFATITTRYTPKIIIVDVSGDLSDKKRDIDALSALLPYYQDIPSVRPVVELRSPFEKAKLLLSRIYPYNSQILTIYKYQSVTAEYDDDGYVPLSRTMSAEPVQMAIDNNDSSPPAASSACIDLLEGMLAEASRLGIQFVLVVSPRYRASSAKIAPHKELISVLAKKYNAVFLDFTTLFDYPGGSAYFDDPAHLNHKGAEIFTRLLSSDLGFRKPEQ